MKKLSLALVVFACLFANAYADDYETRDKAVRDSIWSWDMPMFNIRTVPAEYSNESAIIIAQYDEINAAGKSKLRFLSSLSMNKELYYTNISRKLVKINDKSALEHFSEFNFKETLKQFGHNSMNTMSTYLGARIIKPDGTIKEVNVNEAVKVSENKKGTEGYKKLAIPDLQIGDILDYFMQSEYKIDDENVPQEYFIFGGRYPILNYKVHVEINKKLTAEYRSINNAPEFKQSTEDEITHLDVEKQNLPKFEMVYWTAPYRQLPMIRLNILNNASTAIYKPISARSVGIYADLNPDYVLTDAYNIAYDFRLAPFANPVDTKKNIKKFKSKYANASSEELSDFIYDALAIEWRENSVHFLFLSRLQELLNLNKIYSTYGFATSNNGAKKEEIMEISDLTPFVVTTDGKIYTFPHKFSFAGEITSDIEGETAVSLSEEKAFARAKKTIDFSNAKTTVIPTTSAEENKSEYNFEVGFLDLNSTDMTIKLVQEHSGYLKYDTQSRILNYYDTDKEKRSFLELTKKDMLDEVKSEKSRSELLTNIENRRKSQKDSIKSDLEGFHGLKIKELINYNIISQGVTRKNPNLKYEATYTIEGLIKKAGNSIIFSAGKLIGEQLKVDDDDRNRTTDIYMPFARMFEQKILIYIPEGYKIESVDNFKVNIQNEYASFTSEPSFEGNKLILNIKKSYLKSFIPISEWKKVLEVVDAANVLFGQSIVLKKI